MSKKHEEKEILGDELTEEEQDEVGFEDKRRFNDDGERVEVKINNPGNGAEEAAAPAKPAEVVRLESDLENVTTRCMAAESKLQEVQRRFEEEKSNLENETAEMRVRLKKSLEQQADQSRVSFLTSLLPVLDNLNLALNAAETDASLQNLIDGVKGTARSFEQSLISVGVEPIASVGEKFDPQIHEAVDMVETDEEKEGLIISEYSKGYTFKERLLRPARVQVGTTKL